MFLEHHNSVVFEGGSDFSMQEVEEGQDKTKWCNKLFNKNQVPLFPLLTNLIL
jgi:hypothetical protein